MDRIVVRGGARLEGEIAASGSKNATLALMAAALLAGGESELRNVPRLRDVEAMLELLRALGAALGHDPREAPDSDTGDQPPALFTDRTTYEPVIPFTMADDAARAALPDSILAIRLRSEDGIDPASVWAKAGTVPSALADSLRLVQSPFLRRGRGGP